MKLNIRGNKIEITEAIKNYIEEKLGRLDKYFEKPDDITANVVVRLSGFEQVIEVTIPAKKVILRGEERDKDLYSAIDIVSDKIERQIRKNKTKLKEKGSKDMLLDFILEPEQKENHEIQKIVRRKEIEMKPMSEEEAILQMEMLGHDFFIYNDAEDLSTCVLYKRKDGNYGIIETK